LTAALLFPADVGVRRLRLTRADWQRLGEWSRERLRRVRRPAGGRLEPELLGDLFRARERARQRQARADRPAVTAEEWRTAAGDRPGEREQAPPPSAEEALARLRQARERARQTRKPPAGS